MENLNNIDSARDYFASANHPLPYIEQSMPTVEQNYFWIPMNVSKFQSLLEFNCVVSDRLDAVQSIEEFVEALDDSSLVDVDVVDLIRGARDADNIDADNALEWWNLIAYIIRASGHQLYVSQQDRVQPSLGTVYDFRYCVI